MGNGPTVADSITEELRRFRSGVPGVRGSITATSDGLLVAHDVHGLEPTQIAALVAATNAVAARATRNTDCGQLREVIIRGTDGYLAVYSAGVAAVVAVLGASDMNVGMLNFQARKMIERIADHSAVLAQRPAADSPASPASPTDRRRQGRGAAESLPVRPRLE